MKNPPFDANCVYEAVERSRCDFLRTFQINDTINKKIVKTQLEKRWTSDKTTKNEEIQRSRDRFVSDGEFDLAISRKHKSTKKIDLVVIHYL